MTLTTQIQYDVRDLDGTLIPNKSVSISLKINELKPKYLLHKAVVIQERNNRQGTASCKTRSEVRGGGKKPWKQKGTGRARSGSSNSPLWNGGGVTFGPKPRDYEKKINHKEKQLALTTALYNSLSKTVVVENSFQTVEKANTKNFLNILNKVLPTKTSMKILVVTNQHNENLKLSLRNISNVQLLYSNTLNTRDLLLAKHLLITEDALLKITQTNT